MLKKRSTDYVYGYVLWWSISIKLLLIDEVYDRIIFYDFEYICTSCTTSFYLNSLLYLI